MRACYMGLVGLLACLIAPYGMGQPADTAVATTQASGKTISDAPTDAPSPGADAGEPLSALEPDRSFVPGVGWVALNGDPTHHHDPSTHCSHLFYGHPHFGGEVGTGFATSKHYGNGEYVDGAVTASQLLGNCEHASGAISVTVGGVRGSGFWPYDTP